MRHPTMQDLTVLPFVGPYVSMMMIKRVVQPRVGAITRVVQPRVGAITRVVQRGIIVVEQRERRAPGCWLLERGQA